MTAPRAKARRRSAIRRVAIVGRVSRVAVGKRLGDLETWLRKQGLTVLRVHGEENSAGLSWQPDPKAARAARGADLMITLGGDGTILAAARMLAGTRVPILPINLGRLGFLASFEGHELESAVTSALAGALQAETHRLLRASLESPGAVRPRPLGVALNDVVLKAEATYRALRLDVTAGDTFLGHVIADGLIAASPSGSTAYSLSAGGPIVAPGVEAMVITPVCAHTLAVRPVVVPAEHEVTIEPIYPWADDLFVSYDGQVGGTLVPGDRVDIRRSPSAVCLVRLGTDGYFSRMRQKLRWGDLDERETVK